MSTLLRLFWLGPDARLYPPFQDVNRAVERRTVARCITHPAHRPPDADCLCGFYASTAPALHPLAAGLAGMNAAAAAAGVTPVVVAVELDNPIRTEHAAHAPAGAMRLLSLRAAGVPALVEGRDTWRGSTLTIVGPLHVPTRPGTLGHNLRTTEQRYGVTAVRHDGDIADVVEALAEHTNQAAQAHNRKART